MSARSKQMISAQELDQLKSYAWQQKYRPTTLDDIILPAIVLDPIKKMVRVDKRIPHLLFCSLLPGSGKSTLAKVIINELGGDFIKVNASKDNGIDVVRSVIEPFATRFSIYEDAPKVAWLDEFDGTSNNFQDAFRVPMEEYDQTCSFILTANYKEKISEAVQDRCETFDFNMNSAEVKKEVLGKIIKRMMFILEAENVTYDADTLMLYCNKAYPRFRNIISGIQKYVSGNGNVLDKGILEIDVVSDELYGYIENGNFTGAKEYVFKNSLNIDTIYGDLFRNLLPRFVNNKAKYAPLLITINNYQVQNSQVIDKELNLVAGIMEMDGIIKS